MTAKVPLKVHLRLRFGKREKPRTAGLCGRAVGACDCGPLSVLKSNGPHRSKNLPVKFGFTLKTVSANIAKKLPSQRWPQPLFIPLFNFSHKWLTFAFTGESGYTLGFRRKIAHSGSHDETGGVLGGGGITTLGAFRTFTNIPGPGIRTAYFAAFGSWSGVLSKNAESLGTAMRLCASLSQGVAAPLGCVIFSVSVEIAACMPCAQGLSVCARRGVVSLPSARFTCC